MIDSHCHLDFAALQERFDEHLERAAEAGVRGWIAPGCHPRQWKDLVELAGRSLPSDAKIWPCVGLHPWWVGEEDDTTALADELKQAFETVGAVAIGECGLDSKLAPRGVPEQMGAFETQLAVAKELEVPLVLHQVGAEHQFMQCIERVGLSAAGGVVHGFSGAESWARALIQRGLHLGIGMAITRPNREKLRRVVSQLPLDRLLVETDAPDQAPHRLERGEGRPIHLLDVCRSLAELRSEELSVVQAVTAENARRLFFC